MANTLSDLKAQGDLAAAAGDWATAERLYRKATGKSNHPALSLLHGRALVRLGRHDDAVKVFHRLAGLHPEDLNAQVSLVEALILAGRETEAETRCRKALKNHGQAHTLWVRLGGILMDTGRLTEAEAVLRSALALAPLDALTHYKLSCVKTFRPDDPDLRAMEALREKAPATAELAFALGKAYQDLGRHGEAFAHFQSGNVLARTRFPQALAAEREQAQHIRAVFEKMTFNGQGNPSARPVFIVGMPRSGTSLVEHILAGHADIFGAGELPTLKALIFDTARRLSPDTPTLDGFRAMTDKEWAAFGGDYLRDTRRLAPKAARITDKMPLNFRYLGFIAKAFPKAAIIHCRRNPVDTCVACYTKLFDQGNGWAYDLTDLGGFYRLYEDMMDFWTDHLPGCITEINYEDLVAAPEREAKRLIAACGLEWDSSCLDVRATERTVRTASNVEVRRGIYTTSVERWRAYEPWLGPLLEALKSRANPEQMESFVTTYLLK